MASSGSSGRRGGGGRSDRRAPHCGSLAAHALHAQMPFPRQCIQPRGHANAVAVRNATGRLRMWAGSGGAAAAAAPGAARSGQRPGGRGHAPPQGHPAAPAALAVRPAEPLCGLWPVPGLTPAALLAWRPAQRGPAQHGVQLSFAPSMFPPLISLQRAGQQGRRPRLNSQKVSRLLMNQASNAPVFPCPPFVPAQPLLSWLAGWR